ncbi:MAG: HAMP domain-containing sensor histidine kinase, partial [Pseudomonadota bacterium]
MLVETNLAIFFLTIFLAIIVLGSQRLHSSSTIYHKALSLGATLAASFSVIHFNIFSSNIIWFSLSFIHFFSILIYVRTFSSKIIDRNASHSKFISDSIKNSTVHSIEFKNKPIIYFFIKSNTFKNVCIWSSLLVYCSPFIALFENNFLIVLSLSLSLLALALLTQIAQNIYHLHQRDELCQTTHQIIQKMLQDSDTYALRSIKQYLKPIEEYWIKEDEANTEIDTPQSINKSLKNTFQHIRQACKNYQHIHQLSDQLRTPINEIVTPLEMAFYLDKNSSQTSRLVELAYQNAKNTLANIDRVMEVQEIESGKISVNFAPFSPYNEIQSAIHSIKVKAKIKQLQFLYKIDPTLDENLLLISDGKKIQRLLVEVLENALRTTSKGKIELQVSITPSNVKEELPLKITVQDTGSGQIFNENHDSIPLTEDLLFNKQSMQH